MTKSPVQGRERGDLVLFVFCLVDLHCVEFGDLLDMVYTEEFQDCHVWLDIGRWEICKIPFHYVLGEIFGSFALIR